MPRIRGAAVSQRCSQVLHRIISRTPIDARDGVAFTMDLRRVSPVVGRGAALLTPLSPLESSGGRPWPWRCGRVEGVLREAEALCDWVVPWFFSWFSWWFSWFFSGPWPCCARKAVRVSCSHFHAPAAAHRRCRSHRLRTYAFDLIEAALGRKTRSDLTSFYLIRGQAG
jgi:hypothetical protein